MKIETFGRANRHATNSLGIGVVCGVLETSSSYFHVDIIDEGSTISLTCHQHGAHVIACRNVRDKVYKY